MNNYKIQYVFRLENCRDGMAVAVHNELIYISGGSQNHGKDPLKPGEAILSNTYFYRVVNGTLEYYKGY